MPDPLPHRALIPALAAATLFLGAVVATAWLGDDCLITWRTVYNALDGHGLRWNVLERVQSYTHPLWLGILLGARALGLELWAASIALSLALTATLAAVLLASPTRRGGAVLVLLLLTGSRAFIDYCTSGLESPLTHLLLVLFAGALLRLPPRPPPRAHLAPALLTSLLLLCRPDAALLVAPALGLLLVRGAGGARWGWCAVGLSPAVLWEAFSLVYYGSLVPNTALAKLGADIPLSAQLATGIASLASPASLDLVTLPLLAVALTVCVRGSPTTRALAAGSLAYLVYLVAIGGDFMIGRFHAPAMALLLLPLADRCSRLSPRARWGATALAVAATMLCSTSPLRTGRDFVDEELDSHGLADERGHWFSWSGLLSLRRTETPPFPSRPRAAGPFFVVIRGGGSGSTEAPAGQHGVDLLALSDPLLARRTSTDREHARPGHLMRTLPDGYLLSLERGENLILDPETAGLYDDVRLATQAPLRATGRAAAILRLWSGHHPRAEGRAPDLPAAAARWPAPTP